MRSRHTLTTAAAGLMIALVLTGCAAEVSDVDRAQARVTAAEKDVAQAESDLAAASSAFCSSGSDYVLALDRYGDVLTATAPTVGDVRTGGADLAAPAEDVRSDAEAAVAAKDELATAQAELADAQASLAEAQGTETDAPETPDDETPSAPLAPAASVDRVIQAQADFEQALAGIDDDTTLVQAAEQFNSAAVALELSWLRLLVDAGCVTDEQRQHAEAAVSAYTTALQQDLTTLGYYTGAVDGIYGPLTVQAVADLQQASGLPVTGTMDKATTEALRAALEQAGAAAAQSSVASTAALQQTLKLVGYWDGPVDGVWTPELTAALQALQTELGVAPTGTVDAATIVAFEKALSELEAGGTPEPEPSESEDGSESESD
ncbi:peptidoglycan-binding protein [Microbacterium sp. M3]|uniref:Peptidoglycan-binding protein n=1 Tax=Microbacterium arthrosphaerae TaxID=792652 RepID=A0ABU4H4X4_9MICO|nr:MULTISPECIES: peptidoglycan-binding protein [Microbacterium]MDW4574397.1 peptidoglycan-binding protein [Microbacterium arthrosphaerae]MDW7608252.1 peptidoglycan-binding protein [Microbacterium sp. M3]